MALAACGETLGGCGTWSNWAGNIHCRPQRIVRPHDEAELRAAVLSSPQLRVAGAGHSWSALDCTAQVMIDMRRLTKVLHINSAARQIQVEGGILLRDLDEVVARHGLALATEPTISEITAAGAISTGSHGTGLAHGALSEEVVALEIIDATGRKVTIDDPERLRAARIGLGALGVIYSITFRLVPAFNLELHERVVAASEAFDSLDQLLIDNQHVDLFWFMTEHKVFLRTYNRTTAPRWVPHPVRDWVAEWVLRTWLGQVGLAMATDSVTVAKVLNSIEPSLFPEQTLIDRSDRIFHRFPGHQKVYSMEYVIPIEHTRAALLAIEEAHAATGFRSNVPPYLRFVGGAGDSDLSPMGGRPSCAIEVLSYVGFKGWERFFRNVEQRFLALHGRPHWGKLFFTDPHELYGRDTWSHVNQVRTQLDPSRKFDNELTQSLLRQ
jgi:L-gulonolactone oxidase